MSDSTTPEKQNLVQQLIGLASEFFGWMKETLADSQARKAMLADLGLRANTAGFDLPQDRLDSIDRYRKLKMEELDEEAFLSAVDDILALINAVNDSIAAAGVSEKTVIEELSHRFFQLMTLSFIRLRLPVLYWVAQPLGLIEESLTTQSTAKAYPERIVSIFKGIGDHFESLGWHPPATEEDAKALSDFIFIPLSILLVALDRLFVTYLFGPEWAQEIGEDLAHDLVTDILYGWEILDDDEPPLADRVSDRTLSFLLQKSPEDRIGESLSCTLMIVPRTHGGPALFVAFGGSAGFEKNLRDGWKLKVDVISANALDFLIHFDDPKKEAKNAGTDFGIRFSLEPGKDKDQRPLMLGISDNTRLEFNRFSLSGEISNTGAGIKLVAEDSALVIDAANDADGFISETLPAKETRVAFKFGLGWSTNGGFYLEGGAGLRALIPIAKSLGPVNVQSLQLGLTPHTDGDAEQLAFEAGATLGVALGPVKATIDQVGFQVLLDFARKDRNLGFVDLALGFKPPTGVGLRIDADGVTGGGFLYFDREKGQYAGIVHLDLAGGIAVKGMGLIATRLPDNAPGFSLLIIITAEDFKPIPLPLGFRLTGIGGLLAINRTFDEAALRAGLKTHTLDSVMFPKDPIRNAPQILSNLSKVFPAAKGHHLIGPVLKIEWGKPTTLVTAKLAVVLELEAPLRLLRLLILAQISAILPKPENDLIRLQMDAIGVIDFDQGTAALDATLHDSRLLKKFALTGDMALRLNWEGVPNFALAIGGLHPAFNPPPNFPKLERIAVSLAAGDNPRIRCEAYFALTANTVQFGARAELFASASGFSVQGEIGFDVLIQFDPFFFLADFYAQVQLKRKTTNLFKVRVEGTLAGPRPLHITAKATFEILWWDVSFRIDKTLVEGEKPPLPEPVDVLPQLVEALSHPGNWVGRLPAGQRPMVSLRTGVGAATDVLLHPLGTLTVKQNVVPLDMDISRFGQAPPAGARRFSIGVSLGGQAQTTKPEKDFFAPAQFFEMSDDEKLSRPSFESLPAGLSFGSDEVAISTHSDDWLEEPAIEFETFIFDKETRKLRPADPEDSPKDGKNRYKLTVELLGQQSRFGAAASSDLRRAGRAKYRTTAGKYRIEKEGWSIVATDDLTVQAAPGVEDREPRSYSVAEQALRQLQRTDPAKAAGLTILRFQSEVQASE